MGPIAFVTWGGSGIDIGMAKSLTDAVKEDIPYPFGQILLDHKVKSPKLRPLNAFSACKLFKNRVKRGVSYLNGYFFVAPLEVSLYFDFQNREPE